MTNPLRAPWDTPFQLPPFDLIEDAHFAPALEGALTEARAAVAAICDGSEATFANTIEALARADAPLEKALAPFFAMAGADSNEVREGLMRDFSPVLSAYSSEITANAELFSRIEDLWARRDTLALSDEQARVLMLMRRNFVRSGAMLTGADADRLTAVKQRLSVLGTQFTQNLLADERSWFMPLDDLAGLPAFAIDAARAAGAEKDVGGPVVTLSRSLIVPFLQFSERRDLREKAYAAWTARGENGGKTDNQDRKSVV